MQKLKPTLPLRVTVEIEGLEVYRGKAAIEVRPGLDKLPDVVLHSLVSQGVLKLVPAIRCHDLTGFRALLGDVIKIEFPNDHSQHGRADPAFPSEPAEGGCPCTGHETQLECSLSGCGFCLAAKEMEKRARQKGEETNE